MHLYCVLEIYTYTIYMCTGICNHPNISARCAREYRAIRRVEGTRTKDFIHQVASLGGKLYIYISEFFVAWVAAAIILLQKEFR